MWCPPSEWELLFDKLGREPLDPDGWKRLVDLAVSSGDDVRITQSYDSLLRSFPNTVRALLVFCRCELRTVSFRLQLRSRTLVYLLIAATIGSWIKCSTVSCAIRLTWSYGIFMLNTCSTLKLPFVVMCSYVM